MFAPKIRQIGAAIACLIALGAWIGLVIGFSRTWHVVGAQQWIDAKLWRLACWNFQESLLQAWQATFSLFVPVFLAQAFLQTLLRRYLHLAVLLIFGSTVLLFYLKKPILWSSTGTAFFSSGFAFFVATYWIAWHRISFFGEWYAKASRSVKWSTLFGVGIFFLPTFLPLFLSVASAMDRHMNPPTGPNVLFLVVDSLRADHIDTYGYSRSTMPSVDQLAKDSTVFQNAIAVAPWTTPSISAMLSSRYPRGRVWPPVPYRLPQNMTLLSEIFRNAQYQTAAFVAHYYVAKRIGFSQGFQQYDDSEALGHRHISAPAITQKAIRFLEQKRDEPFFLFLHYFDPHYDYFEHEPYIFSQGYTGELKNGPIYLDLKNNASKFSSEDLQFVRALYDSEIRFTDDQIRHLLDYLKAKNLYEDTLIVFVADHGEDFCDRADCHIGHIEHLYRSLINVPFLLKLPKQASQEIIEQSVSMIDVAPTIAHYAKLPNWQVAPFEGRPLLWDQGRITQASPIFSETRGQLAWVSWPWKLLVDTERNVGELYDIQADPYETQNRVGDFTNVFSRLRQELTQFTQDHPVEAKNKVHQPASFSAEELEQLKAMGYIQ